MPDAIDTLIDHPPVAEYVGRACADLGFDIMTARAVIALSAYCFVQGRVVEATSAEQRFHRMLAANSDGPEAA